MTNNKKKNVLIVILVVLCTFFLALANKSLSNGIPLDEVKISKEDKERFAIKIEDSNGDYVDYVGNTWPGIGYTFNEDESKCVNKNGEIVNNVLEYSNYRVTVKTKKTVFCYLYFDIAPRAYEILAQESDYTLYTDETNLEAGTFYRYSGDYDGKRNVIYADHCWQIFRTTKNDSIKMIYNGEPAYDSSTDKYTCDNSRTNTNHIGYTREGTRRAFGAPSGNTYNYYYGTGYYYDDVAGVYKLSNEVGPYNYYYDHDLLIGMYTCGKRSADANCIMGYIYYLEEFYDQTTAYIFTINTGMTYDRIGKTPFNFSDESPADVGYMYNTRYTATEKAKSVTMLSSISLSTSNLTTWGNYYFGDREEGNATLINPVQGSSITDYPQSWGGKYTLMSSNQSATNSLSIYVSGVTSDATPKLYYATFYNNTTKDSSANKYLFGTGFTSNNDGTVTMSGAFEISKGDWYVAYNNNQVSTGIYMCLSETYTYDSNSHTGICNDGINSVIAVYTQSIDYIPVNIKYGYSFEERTIQEQQDGRGKYKLVGNNSLTNALHIVTNWTTDYNTLTNSHYTCFNEEGICDKLYFVTNTYKTRLFYIEIPANKSIDVIVDEMLNNNDVNTNNSVIKNMIDLWYKEHILNKEDNNHNQLSSYLDTDEIFCNNRAAYNYGGWSQTGDAVTSLEFMGDDINNSGKKISCIDSNNQERVIDEFSVSAGNHALIYPIGLPSYSEMYLQTMNTGSSPIRKSPYGNGVNYWLGSPIAFNGDAKGNGVFTSGTVNGSIGISVDSGVRPSLSLNHNVVFSEGTGTMSDPWIAALPN